MTYNEFEVKSTQLVTFIGEGTSLHRSTWSTTLHPIYRLGNMRIRRNDTVFTYCGQIAVNTGAKMNRLELPMPASGSRSHRQNLFDGQTVRKDVTPEVHKIIQMGDEAIAQVRRLLPHGAGNTHDVFESGICLRKHGAFVSHRSPNTTAM